MKYNVTITEKLERIVEVEAESPEDARDIVEDMYNRQEIILFAEDMHENATYEVELV